MRNAAQCVGRVLRGKTDWGLMVFADKVRRIASSFHAIVPQRSHFNFDSVQRFARADKRAKLPRWINQYITETAANLSTDMALTLSKLFMRTISQSVGENLTGVSLWTKEDVEKAQAAQRIAEAEAVAEAERLRLEREAAGDGDMVDEEDEYGDGGFSDRMLIEMDV